MAFVGISSSWPLKKFCQYHKCIAPDKLFPVEGQEVWKELLSLFQLAFVSSNLKGLLEIKTTLVQCAVFPVHFYYFT